MSSNRNYSVKPKEQRETILLHGCGLCNKKYKTEPKLKEHVEKQHYYATVGRNYAEISAARIFSLAETYAKTIQHINSLGLDEYLSDDVLMSQVGLLLPHKENIDVADRDIIAKAHYTFVKSIYANKILERCNWRLVLDDFRDFIRLGTPYYDTNFCPSMPIDFLWHAAMQDPVFYKKLSFSAIGKILPHCQKVRSEEEDDARYKYFCDVFTHVYRRAPYVPGADTNTSVNFSILAREAEEQEVAVARDKELLELRLTEEARRRKEEALWREEALRKRDEELRRREADPTRPVRNVALRYERSSC